MSTSVNPDPPIPPRPLPIVGRATTCPRCGTTFTCGAASGHCWCFDLPKLPMSSDAAECLCPACLGERIAAASTPRPPHKAAE